MIGIMGALGEEIDLVCEMLEDSQPVEKAGIQFFKGRLSGEPVVVVKCGVGKVNAAICAQILIDLFECGQVIFAGVAGALLAGLKQGDLVVSSHAVQFDIDLTAFGRRHGELADHDRLIPADPDMIKAATEAYDIMAETEDAPMEMIVGTIVSGDSFISDPETIKWLQREFSAACTEMEGGAVGYTCMINQIPFVILRIISDSAGDDAVDEFDSFLSRCSHMLCRLICSTVEQLNSDP